MGWRVGLVARHYRPDNPGHLVGQRHNRDVGVSSAAQLLHPLMKSRRAGALLGDLRLLAGGGQALALGCLHLDLAQLEHDLFPARLLTSPHPRLLQS